MYCPLAASGDKDTDTHSSAITELLKFAIAATIPMHRDVSPARSRPEEGGGALTGETALDDGR